MQKWHYHTVGNGGAHYFLFQIVPENLEECLVHFPQLFQISNFQSPVSYREGNGTSPQLNDTSPSAPFFEVQKVCSSTKRQEQVRH